MSKMQNSISNLLKDKLVVEDMFGGKHILYEVDVCCGKALVISVDTNKLSIKQITDLKCVSGMTFKKACEVEEHAKAVGSMR